jgi:hypothetical protein
VIHTPRLADGVVRVRDEFAHHLVIDGRLAGSWRRTVKADNVFVEVAPYGRLTRAHALAVASARARYGRFMQMTVR